MNINPPASLVPVSFETQSANVEMYEAPAIEAIITAEELEREVHYAGIIAPSGGAIA